MSDVGNLLQLCIFAAIFCGFIHIASSIKIHVMKKRVDSKHNVELKIWIGPFIGIPH
jgi:hypothetical protein